MFPNYLGKSYAHLEIFFWNGKFCQFDNGFCLIISHNKNITDKASKVNTEKLFNLHKKAVKLFGIILKTGIIRFIS